MDDVLHDEFWDGMDRVCSAHATISIQIEDDDGIAFIAFLSSSVPGRGHGTVFMEDLIRHADACRMDLSLDPSELGGSRLIAWYARLGFVEASDGRMIRSPAPVPVPRI